MEETMGRNGGVEFGEIVSDFNLDCMKLLCNGP